MTERRKKSSSQTQKDKETEYKPTLTKKEQILQIIKKKTKRKIFI